MGVFLFILLIVFLASIVVVPVIVMQTRRKARIQKNYERGLKMVPLLIHLPPISEDIDANGRDSRDLIDENISKAQVIYNIIASTYEKGFKRRLYGQQHLAFEIVSTEGFVYFYTTVPIGLVEVVRQAIVSAYPSARLEEVEEHNIFNVSSMASGVTGGELVMRESFAYPINTYQDLKRDSMQGILNSLANVSKEDGAAIQILIRPADPGWRKTAHDLAAAKRKGEDVSGEKIKAVGGLMKDMGTALYKPPEEKDSGSSDKQLSDMELSVLNAIDDKTRYPAYEVLIRLIASSNVQTKSQNIMNAMVSAFSEFNSQEKNGFKYEPASDVEELTTSYIMRFFPQNKNKLILNSVELASLFHFPDQRSIPTTQLERQDSKQVDGPRNMPQDGTLLGYNVFRGVKKPIRLSVHDRQRHMYVVGQTGTGKSTYLENLALQDMMAGNGFAFVDPHGDTAEKLLSMVPKNRTEDVIYFSPAEMDFPLGLNLFETHNADQKDFIIQEVLNMLYKLYDPQRQGIMGPRYEDMFRNAALAVMADPEGGTFIEIPQLFRDPEFLKRKLRHVKDQTVLDFWQKQFTASQRSNEAGEVTAWFVSKFGAFLSNEMMRNIIGQTKSSFDLRDIMDNKKILLVNLSKGRTGDLNSKLLGMIFVMKFQAAAMSRANIPEKDRVDFSLYVDEFQNFSTDSFATIMSEARKYHLNLIVANQFTTQLTEEIRDAVFGNMGTIVAFRIGQNDVDSLSRYFQPVFDGDDLLRVPNYNTIVRTLVGGVPTQPFSMSTLPPLGEPNEKLSGALKQLSAAKYGRPKASVEKDIFSRIRTTPSASQPAQPQAASRAMPPQGAGWPQPPQPSGVRPPYGQNLASPQPVATQSPMQQGQAGRSQQSDAAQPPAHQPAGARPAPGSASFLDEWLARRNTPVAGKSPGIPGPSASTPEPSIVRHAPQEMMTEKGTFQPPDARDLSPVRAERPGDGAPAHSQPVAGSGSGAQNGSPVAEDGRERSPSRKRRRKRKSGSNSPDSKEYVSGDAGAKPAPLNTAVDSQAGVMQLQHDAEDLHRLQLEKEQRRRQEIKQAQIELAEKFNREVKPPVERTEEVSADSVKRGADDGVEPAVSDTKPVRREFEDESAVTDGELSAEGVNDQSPDVKAERPAHDTGVQNDDKTPEPSEPSEPSGENAEDGVASDESVTEDRPSEDMMPESDSDVLKRLKDAARNGGHLNHGDTIVIDQEGNLQFVEPEVQSEPNEGAKPGGKAGDMSGGSSASGAGSKPGTEEPRGS